MQNTTTQKDSSVPIAPKNPHLVHNLEPAKNTKITVNFTPVLVGAAIIAAGMITGYVLAQGGPAGKTGKQINGATTADGLKKVVGVDDKKTFNTNAEGTLRAGGTAGGEGTHYLERAGGPSQNVYLTSSSVPLDDYVGKKVKVDGQTFSAKTAGWLMDVGRLELVE